MNVSVQQLASALSRLSTTYYSPSTNLRHLLFRSSKTSSVLLLRAFPGPLSPPLPRNRSMPSSQPNIHPLSLFP
ncbi:hypothetical protein BDY24DRAFT_387813 [Mrakia frigida]|uniref:uncharacterized protein n=1 Tax=Mrakia frigida TaxID=29902 RepID=UPI003FCC0F13